MKIMIHSEAIASSIETDLEGRIEVMEDDDMYGTPDHEDASAIAQVMREIAAFPAEVELSDAQMQQLAITVENVLDWDDETADLGELREALKIRGYPR
jgi:hypothetical protein